MAGSVAEFTDANWKTEVLESAVPVVVVVVGHERPRLADEEGRSPVAQALAGLGQRETGRADAIERAARSAHASRNTMMLPV